MRTLNALLATASLITLSACASIIEGSTDHVTVNTAPASNANCTLTNTRGSYATTGLAPAAVKKSINALDIACTDASGATGTTKLESEIEPWAIGNILIGGLIGLGVDWGTGAAYNYPDSTTVSLALPPTAVPEPQNTYIPALPYGSTIAPAAPAYNPAQGSPTQQPVVIVPNPTPYYAPVVR